MNVFGQIVLYFLAIALVGLSYRLVHKEKYPLAFLSFSLSVLLALAAYYSGSQALIRTEVIKRTMDGVDAFGKKLDDFQLTTAKMKEELAQHQTQIDKHQKELDEQQGKIRSSQFNIADQQTNVANQYQKISTVQKELATAQTNVSIQQKKIEDVEYLVDNLFSKKVFERISAADTNRVVKEYTTNGGCRIVLRLSHTPIQRSTRVMVFPGGAMNIPTEITGDAIPYKNILAYRLWGFDMNTTSFEVSYTKDTRQTNTVEDVKLKDEQVFADGIQIPIIKPPW